MDYVAKIKEKYPQYLNDESNIVKAGNAERLYFPKNEDDVRQVLQSSKKDGKPITISGGGTGISGGRVPLEGWIIATDKMTTITKHKPQVWKDPDSGITYQVKLDEIDDNEALLTVPVAMTVKAIQNFLRGRNWFYPPDPTERTSFIGGNVSTNASGARCFKYGATRRWVQSIRVVLEDGDIIFLDRDDGRGDITKEAIVIECKSRQYHIPRPSYSIPKVSKHVAGPVITDESHPIDLFIGTNGIFGAVTEVTIKLIRPPTDIIGIFAYCNSSEQAFALIERCQQQRRENVFPVPMSVEFLDERAVDIMRAKDPRIEEDTRAILMIEQDVFEGEGLDEALLFWTTVFEELGIEQTDVAQNYSEIEEQKALRHYVPEYVIALNRSFDQSLVVSDFSVPEDKYQSWFDYLIEKGEEFRTWQNNKEELDKGNPGFTLFGHAGDCHPHMTLLPRNKEESEYAQRILVEVLEQTVRLGGSIASEHGLGKKWFGGKPALKQQYGDKGYKEVIAMKRALDPDMRLSPHNLVE